MAGKETRIICTNVFKEEDIFRRKKRCMALWIALMEKLHKNL